MQIQPLPLSSRKRLVILYDNLMHLIFYNAHLDGLMLIQTPKYFSLLHSQEEAFWEWNFRVFE